MLGALSRLGKGTGGRRAMARLGGLGLDAVARSLHR
jgi:hypothetical protein